MSEVTHEPEKTQVECLWERFKTSDDADARERLILHYSPLVEYVAGRVGAGLPRSVDQNDLASYGLFGLIDAIDKFDPDRGFKFETYAIDRIKGAILDELRALDWVPRSVRSRARRIERALAELEHKLQRAPSEEELAQHIEMELDSLRESLAEIGRSGVAALDEFVSPDVENTRTEQRDRRWAFRVKSRSDALVREAAALTGQTITAFVEESAVARAESVIAEHQAVTLSPDEFSKFMHALDEAPVAVPELVELFSQPSRIPEA